MSILPRGKIETFSFSSQPSLRVAWDSLNQVPSFFRDHLGHHPNDQGEVRQHFLMVGGCSFPTPTMVVDTAPALPRGAVRGCSYMKLRVEGRFFLSPGWSPTPPNSMLNRLSSSRGSPWCFSFFERIRFQDFFYFFVEKTLLLMKNQHFIIIITFHQITHQLVLSIFTWDFIFSSKFSL